VAKALGCGESKIATCGIGRPAICACRATVSSSQRSLASAGWPITRAPVLRTAIQRDRASEIKAPPMPNTAANPNSAGRSRPFWVRNRSTPSRRLVTASTASTARLVSRNKPIRFMANLGLQVTTPGQPMTSLITIKIDFLMVHT
jgi:hypothetical protein